MPRLNCNWYCCIDYLHARIQKILPGRGPDKRKNILVINFFAESGMDIPRGAIEPRRSNCSSRWVRTSISKETCSLLRFSRVGEEEEGSEPPVPVLTPLYPCMKFSIVYVLFICKHCSPPTKNVEYNNCL